MNKIVRVPAQPLVNLPAKSHQSRMEAERIREVLILLESLTVREEETIKLIIDRLYDIGYANLIDRKVSWRLFNSIAKSIARMSKPVFRIFAWRWFKNNCPQLIANWLHSKVKFTD
jgi:hypothetical protein